MVKNENKSQSVALAFLLGLATGSIALFLSNENNRKDVKSTIKDMKKLLMRKIKEGKDRIKDELPDTNKSEEMKDLTPPLDL